ncbi:hypothetical protein PR048_015034 [Dryococelus australis]|uniref:Uncharacterized protein n=1 Tax=Dryococelus australis TaxID=614101 RepID=A0ABQ9HG07_9NEOP|nr:hypothetical protein PR048_015034 [Dryococelus australis]
MSSREVHCRSPRGRLDVSALNSPFEPFCLHCESVLDAVGTGGYTPVGEGSGRPRRTTNMEEAVSTPQAYLRTIQEHVMAAGDKSVSTSTIPRWIVEQDLSSRRPLRLNERCHGLDNPIFQQDKSLPQAARVSLASKVPRPLAHRELLEPDWTATSASGDNYEGLRLKGTWIRVIIEIETVNQYGAHANTKPVCYAVQGLAKGHVLLLVHPGSGLYGQVARDGLADVALRVDAVAGGDGVPLRVVGVAARRRRVGVGVGGGREWRVAVAGGPDVGGVQARRLVVLEHLDGDVAEAHLADLLHVRLSDVVGAVLVLADDDGRQAGRQGVRQVGHLRVVRHLEPAHRVVPEPAHHAIQTQRGHKHRTVMLKEAKDNGKTKITVTRITNRLIARGLRITRKGVRIIAGPNSSSESKTSGFITSSILFDHVMKTSETHAPVYVTLGGVASPVEALDVGVVRVEEQSVLVLRRPQQLLVDVAGAVVGGQGEQALGEHAALELARRGGVVDQHQHRLVVHVTDLQGPAGGTRLLLGVRVGALRVVCCRLVVAVVLLLARGRDACNKQTRCGTYTNHLPPRQTGSDSRHVGVAFESRPMQSNLVLPMSPVSLPHFLTLDAQLHSPRNGDSEVIRDRASSSGKQEQGRNRPSPYARKPPWRLPGVISRSQGNTEISTAGPGFEPCTERAPNVFQEDHHSELENFGLRRYICVSVEAGRRMERNATPNDYLADGRGVLNFVSRPYLERGGRDDEAARLLDSHQGESGSIPDLVTPEFSHVGIVPDDAASVFSAVFRFTRPCIPTLLHSHLISPSSTLNTTLTRRLRLEEQGAILDSRITALSFCHYTAILVFSFVSGLSWTTNLPSFVYKLLLGMLVAAGGHAHPSHSTAIFVYGKCHIQEKGGIELPTLGSPCRRLRLLGYRDMHCDKGLRELNEQTHHPLRSVASIPMTIRSSLERRHNTRRHLRYPEACLPVCDAFHEPFIHLKMNCDYEGLPLTSTIMEPQPASSLPDFRQCRFCDRVLTQGQNARRHERIACMKSHLRAMKNCDIGSMQSVQGNTLK